MDKLEQYVKQHREAFDAAEPNPNIWADIVHSMSNVAAQHDEFEQYISAQHEAFDSEMPNDKIWAGITQSLDQETVKDAQLEQYVVQHKAAFNTATPDTKVWNGIEQSLQKERKVLPINWLKTVRLAASIVLLLGIGASIGMWYAKPHKLQELATTRTSLSEISPEYAELEEFYSRKVSARMDELSKAQLQTQFDPSIKELDAIYRELQAEFERAPERSRAQIIQAMIKNYQTKLSVLERVLEQHQQHSISQPHQQLSI